MDKTIPRPSEVTPAPTESENFIIDPLFPTREIHLIAGGSGSGKSTLACQLARELIGGGEIFHLPISRPYSVGYLAFDRSVEGMRRTFERTLDTDSIPFPFYSTITSPQFAKPEHSHAVGAIEHFRELQPQAEILFVDGIGMAFTGDSSSLVEVSKFVQSLVRLLKRLPNPLTIIALHHMGKVKKGNEYAAARSRLHGSVAWAATAETCILIEAETEEDVENPNRIITICPRNAAERRYTYAFDEDGRLIPAASLDNTRPRYRAFLSHIKSLPEARDITMAELETIAFPLEISSATTKRYIAQMIEESILHRVRRGVYQRLGVRLTEIR